MKSTFCVTTVVFIKHVYNYVCLHLHCKNCWHIFIKILVTCLSISLTCLCLLHVVTLFEVMVGADWWIVMEGVTTANDDENTRAYFLAFMISTAVS